MIFSNLIVYYKRFDKCCNIQSFTTLTKHICYSCKVNLFHQSLFILTNYYRYAMLKLVKKMYQMEAQFKVFGYIKKRLVFIFMLLTDSNIYNMRHLEAVKKNLPRRSKEIPTTASVVAYDIKNFKTCFRCNMHVLENFPFSNRWIIHQISCFTLS